MSEFNYPNVCACCCQNEPEVLWKLKCSEVVLHEPELGMRSSKTFNDFVTHVPICTGCERTIKWWGGASWVLGLACGAAVGLALGLKLAAETELKLPGIYLSAALAGVVAAAISGCLAHLVFTVIGLRQFAEYRPRESKIHFLNKQYQQLFDRLNFTTHIPATQAQQEQWAKPWG